MNDTALITQGTLSFNSAKQAPQFGAISSPEEAREVAVKFEAFFLGQMMQPMFANIGTEPPFGGGPAERIWRSMMVDEYGNSMAKAGGIGIADSVYTEILRAQEARLP